MYVKNGGDRNATKSMSLPELLDDLSRMNWNEKVQFAIFIYAAFHRICREYLVLLSL